MGWIEKKSNCFLFGPTVTLKMLFDSFDFLFTEHGLLLQKSIMKITRFFKVMFYRYTFHNKIQQAH